MGPTDCVIKVYFTDGSYKSLRINESDSTRQVINAILEKVTTLSNTKGLLLYMASKENSDVSYQEIAENENPGVIYKKWESEKPIDKFRLVFKKKKDTLKWNSENSSSSPTNQSSPGTNSPPHEEPTTAAFKPPSRPPPTPTSMSVEASADQPSPPSRPTPQPGMMMGGGNPLLAELAAKKANNNGENVIYQFI